MDTNEVAEKLGTTPRQLRVFLRSPFSTYVAVGSGARYDFNDNDFSTIEKRFREWKAAGKPKPDKITTDAPNAKRKMSNQEKRRLRDMAEWAEEGVVTLPDIRDPRVRARVKADAAAAERRLELQMLAAGIHITQRA